MKSEPKLDNIYLAAKKQIYKFQLEQLLRTLRSACFRLFSWRKYMKLFDEIRAKVTCLRLSFSKNLRNKNMIVPTN